MLNCIMWILAALLVNCANQVNDQSGKNETVPASSGNIPQNTDSSENDSLTVLAKIYSQAIAEYGRAVHKMEKTDFDSLFFGKQFDFPDIELPTTINGATICILTPEEVNNKKLSYGKSSPYINLIGFIEHDRAEFIFVTFYPEFHHQYDCHMNFKCNSQKKEFELDKLQIEILIYNKEGKADHYAIYQDGKHVGDKPIEEIKK